MSDQNKIPAYGISLYGIFLSLKSTEKLTYHNFVYNFTDKCFKLVQWSLLFAIINQANTQHKSVILLIIYSLLYILVTAWVTFAVVNLIANRITLSLSAERVASIFLFIALGALSITANNRIQHFLKDFFKGVVITNIVK